jgi:formylglycine-generating enzyme required for sulfatase activity
MGYNPSEHNEWQNFINPQGPVENMTWDECQEFISRLNEMTGLHFRLPTEAEWEFAARGGNRSMPYSYSGSRYIEEVAWYRSNADNHHGGVSGPQTVALLLPNELGLYDMSGNVWEYCQDWYGPYNDEPQTDPKGPSTGTARVMSGGSFIESSNSCKCAKRDYTQWYDEGANTIGFRLAM